MTRRKILTVTPFFRLPSSYLIPRLNSYYPILILLHRLNRGYRSTQLFGSSEATVSRCRRTPGSAPNILIAINNVAVTKQCTGRRLTAKNPWINYSASSGILNVQSSVADRSSHFRHCPWLTEIKRFPSDRDTWNGIHWRLLCGKFMGKPWEKENWTFYRYNHRVVIR